MIILILLLMQISLLPKQIQLKNLIEDSEYELIGYGGARGGAKSHAIRELAILFGYKYGTKSLIFRRYSQELLENHVYPLFKQHPELRKYFNKTEKVLYDNNGNPIVKMGYADSEDDIHKFQGTEYDIVFIDEATQCTQPMIEFLRTSNRTTNSSLQKAKMVLTMNPGGVGHAYIKRLFIDKIYQDNENPDDYVFIQSHVWDNVYWLWQYIQEKNISVKNYYHDLSEKQRKELCLEHSSYAKNLASLPEELKLAYLYGDWEIFGGMFFKEFNKNRQVIKPFEIPTEWKLISSIDPGFSSPCSFGLTAQDFEKNIYRIATYYEAGKNPEQHAKDIVGFLNSELIQKLTGGKKPELNISGRDAWARRDRYSILASEKTFADVFLEHGLHLTPAVTDRIPGWWAWKSLFPDRYLLFKSLNEPLLKQMTSIESDPKNVEDIQGKGNDREVEDHAIDEQRYGIMSLYTPIKKSSEPDANPGRDDTQRDNFTNPYSKY